MDLSTITIATFKARFNRDFQYQNVPNSAIPSIPDPDFVQDQDITNAFADAEFALNQALFGCDSDITLAYLYLTAHHLCVNIQGANAGISGPGALPVGSRSVGSVSESYDVPAEYKDNAFVASYIQTSYGLKFLAMALPRTVGNMAALPAVTNP